MSETKAVRLDKDIMNTLAEKREGFETPNECLKRLLDGQMRPCADEVVDSNES
jgi:hypothetical protein